MNFYLVVKLKILYFQQISKTTTFKRLNNLKWYQIRIEFSNKKYIFMFINLYINLLEGLFEIEKLGFIKNISSI